MVRPFIEVDLVRYAAVADMGLVIITTIFYHSNLCIMMTNMSLYIIDNPICLCCFAATDMELVAEFTGRNEPIFHTDSDFEVFIDADGSNVNYKVTSLRPNRSPSHYPTHSPHDLVKLIVRSSR